MSNHSHTPIDTHPASAPGLKDWLALAALALAQFMLILDVTVINVALPELSRDIGLAAGSAGWAIAAYAIPFGGLMLLGGRAADLFGSRRIFLIGLTLFTAASFAAGLAADASTLIAARVMQGIGAALLSPAALATLTTRFSGNDRNRALGVWAAIGGVGAAFGVLLGGLLTAGPGWRWIFYINVPVGVLVAVVLPLLVPAITAPAKGQRLDILGGGLITAAAAALSFGIMNVRLDADVLTWLVPIGLALGLAAMFAIVERRTVSPLIDLKVLGRKPIQAGIFVMFLASVLLIGGFFLLSFMLQSSLHWSPLTTGLAFLPVALGTLIGAHLGGTLISHLGGRILATVAFGIAAAGFGLAALQLDNPILLIAGIAIAGSGLGAAFVASTTSALSEVGHHEAGIVSGLVNTFHEVGGAVGVAVVSATAAASLMSPTSVEGFVQAFGISAGTAIAGAAVAAVVVPAGKPSPGTPRFAH